MVLVLEEEVVVVFMVQQIFQPCFLDLGEVKVVMMVEMEDQVLLVQTILQEGLVEAVELEVQIQMVEMLEE